MVASASRDLFEEGKDMYKMNDAELVAQALVLKVMKAMDEVVRTPEEIAETPLEFLCPEVYQNIHSLAAAAAVAVMEEIIKENGDMELPVEDETKWS